MSVSMTPSIVRVRARGEDEINKYQTILTTKSFVLTHSISRLLLLWLLILSIVIHTSLSSDFMIRFFEFQHYEYSLSFCIHEV